MVSAPSAQYLQCLYITCLLANIHQSIPNSCLIHFCHSGDPATPICDVSHSWEFGSHAFASHREGKNMETTIFFTLNNMFNLMSKKTANERLRNQ